MIDNFAHIETGLKNFSFHDRTSHVSKLIQPDQRLMMWSICKTCNLQCGYCHANITNTNEMHDWDAINAAFEKSGFQWYVNITGGEPFILRGFVGFLEKFTKKNSVSINTNLTIPEIENFASRISPENITGINASYHHEELLKHPELLKRYFRFFRLLSEKGFNIMASVVVYPPLLDNFDRILHSLQNEGIRQVMIRPYLGDYENFHYPEKYSREEKEKILADSTVIYTQKFEFAPFLSKGRKCSSGKHYYYLDHELNVHRCLTVRDYLGSFLSKEWLYKKVNPKCPARECICVFEGMVASSYSPKRLFNFF